MNLCCSWLTACSAPVKRTRLAGRRPVRQERTDSSQLRRISELTHRTFGWLLWLPWVSLSSGHSYVSYSTTAGLMTLPVLSSVLLEAVTGTTMSISTRFISFSVVWYISMWYLICCRWGNYPCSVNAMLHSVV